MQSQLSAGSAIPANIGGVSREPCSTTERLATSQEWHSVRLHVMMNVLKYFMYFRLWTRGDSDIRDFVCATHRGHIRLAL